jgi:hypothetical protein
MKFNHHPGEIQPLCEVAEAVDTLRLAGAIVSDRAPRWVGVRGGDRALHRRRVRAETGVVFERATPPKHPLTTQEE